MVSIEYTPLHQCTKCGIEKPLTAEFFPQEKRNKSGFYGVCRDCVRNRNEAYRRDNPEKTRETCRRWYRHNREKKLSADKRRYYANREQVLESQKRRRRQTNPERMQENARRWRAENPEKWREYRKRYCAENPDKVREAVRRWTQANPEKRKAYDQRRRARKQGLPDSFTSQDWAVALEYFEYRCAVCGRPAGLWHTLAADHWIPLNSPDCPGTIPSNIIPLCHGDGGCNNSKNDRDSKEWLMHKFGKHKTAKILTRIEAYFDQLRAKE